MKPLELSKRPKLLLSTLAEFRYALRHFLQFSEQIASNAGLQPQQYQMMLQVAAAPENITVTVAYVAERMRLKHNSTVELLDRSEREGLVARREDPADRRRTIVLLTRKGEKLLDRLAGDHARELTVLAPQLIRTLERVRQQGPNDDSAGKVAHRNVSSDKSR